MRTNGFAEVAFCFGTATTLSSASILLYGLTTQSPLPLTNRAGQIALQAPGAMEFASQPLCALAVCLVSVAPLVRWPSGRVIACLASVVGAAMFCRLGVDLLHQEVLSPWTWLTTLGFATMALSAPRFRAQHSNWATMTSWTFAGLALPFLMPAIPGLQINPESPSPQLLVQVTDRTEITGHQDQSSYESILWGSPECPATIRRLPKWVSEGRARKCRLIFRFVPVSHTAGEREAAAMLKARIEESDPELASSTWNSNKVYLTLIARRVSPLKLALYRREVTDDVLLARRMAVREVPIVQNCEPNSACRIAR